MLRCHLFPLAVQSGCVPGLFSHPPPLGFALVALRSPRALAVPCVGSPIARFVAVLAFAAFYRSYLCLVVACSSSQLGREPAIGHVHPLRLEKALIGVALALLWVLCSCMGHCVAAWRASAIVRVGPCFGHCAAGLRFACVSSAHCLRNGFGCEAFVVRGIVVVVY